MEPRLLQPGGGWAGQGQGQGQGEGRLKGARLGFAEELPEWQAAYPFVETGYRLDHSACDCIRSAARLHNETVNIHTHLLGAVAWAACCARALGTNEALRSADAATRRAHVALYAAAGVMPLLSAAAHCLAAAGARTAALVWRLDLLGILLLLFARALLEGYLTLYCHRLELSLWLALSTSAYLGGGLFTVALADERPLAPLALLLHLPMLHLRLVEAPRLDPPRRAQLLAALAPTLAGSACGALGFAMRHFNVPERFFASANCDRQKRPRLRLVCDVFGASHQWWHILTVLGPLLCMYGNLDLLAYRTDHSHTCPTAE